MYNRYLINNVWLRVFLEQQRLNLGQDWDYLPEVSSLLLLTIRNDTILARDFLQTVLMKHQQQCI